MPKSKVKCYLRADEYNKFSEESLSNDRSKSNLMTGVFEIATNGFTDFSIVDKPNKMDSKKSSPRYYSVETKWSSEKVGIIAEEANNRKRTISSFVYLVLRNATMDFSDFSIVKGSIIKGGSNGDSV